MMARLLCQFVYLLSLALLCSASSDAVVQDTIRKVIYRGIVKDGIESFYGIPFAENVDGTKRFSRPVAKKVAPGTTINATTPGPACPQQKVPVSLFPFFSNVTDVSENCLNLRVDRVANSHAYGSLPVMVYIYGGGYSIGQAYDRLYTPTGLLLGAAAKKTPVIYVAMNYRVNIFGFAASDALHNERNTNVGLLDQTLALKWVKDNIQQFGGDPNKITIFGESDGATSVGLQMTAYGGQGAAGLFQRAIMQSGSPVSDSVTGNSSAVGTLAVAKALNCPLSPSKATLRCMRSAPLASLLKATLAYEKEAHPPFGFDAFVPYVDGSFIPAAPSELIRQGKFLKGVSTIIGWNRDDSSLFTSPKIQNQTGVAEDLAAYGLNKPTIARTLALYPGKDFTSHNNASGAYYRASRIGRDIEAVCPSLFFAQAIAKTSPQTAQNVFTYQLDQSPLAALFARVGFPFYGVSHFSDIFYVFNEVLGVKDMLGATDSDVKLASRMSGSWAAFAASGIPGSAQGRAANATLGKWVPTFRPNGAVNVFAIGGDGEGNVALNNATKQVGLDQLMKRCEFLTSKQVFSQLQT